MTNKLFNRKTIKVQKKKKKENKPTEKNGKHED
jgi:hypothetical protein